MGKGSGEALHRGQQGGQEREGLNAKSCKRTTWRWVGPVAGILLPSLPGSRVPFSTGTTAPQPGQLSTAATHPAPTSTPFPIEATASYLNLSIPSWVALSLHLSTTAMPPVDPSPFPSETTASFRVFSAPADHLSAVPMPPSTHTVPSAAMPLLTPPCSPQRRRHPLAHSAPQPW